MNIIKVKKLEVNTDLDKDKQRFPKRFRNLFNTLKKHRFSERFIFIIIGVASTVWFLIRVIPKPQRAAYPCMRVAAPIMSGFVLWLLSASATVVSFRYAGNYFSKSRYLYGGLFLALALTAGIVSEVFNPSYSLAESNTVLKNSFTANNPIGQAKGIHPGRVVWVWDPDATNEDMRNGPFDYWYQKGNADKDVIYEMIDNGIKDLVGVDNAFAAWDSVFTYFNTEHGREKQGYRQGEKIFIKLNLTNSVHPGDDGMYGPTEHPEYMDDTPEVVFALLKQLINVYHVNQDDIYVGDNFRAFRDTYWKLCHGTFPDVHYIDGIGTDGREKTQKSATEVLHFSDGTIDVCLPQHILDATYLINLAALKTHNSAGVTLTAKNHQGSIIKIGDAVSGTMNVGYAHESLPDADPGYKKYRHLVDYMGHKDLGGKTLLFIIDGIWSGREFWGKIYKWSMAPFNGDYPSSIFLSQDEVAIQSVAYDFLLEEFYDKPDEDKLPYMSGVDDFLFQAADASYWPDGIQYDPENDGTVIGSLGVYEHWNDTINKEYSRNLGTGDGIELIKHLPDTGTGINDSSIDESSISVYPNPVIDQATVKINNDYQGDVLIKLFDLNGRLISIRKKHKSGMFTKLTLDAEQLPSGTYIVVVNMGNKNIEKKIIKK